MFLAAITLLLLGEVVTAAISPAWTWQSSQEIFHSILGEGNFTECEWFMPEVNVVSHGSQFTRDNETGYGICAASIETCIHIGTIPRPVTERFKGVNCTACCARSSCVAASAGTVGGDSVNGYCMLPKLLPVSYNATGNETSSLIGSSYGQSPSYDLEEQACYSIGGNIGTDNATWWGTQCPLSGRCCLFPVINKCETCGRKSGKDWNWSKPAMARSDTQEEALAWKTAVNQMAGTGFSLGMQPVATPAGYSEQYSQSPPTYDSLVPPQLWNNFLNRPNAAIKKGDNDDEDEEEYRGWCWQASILSKLDGSLRCSGALVGEQYILTTASCASFTSDTFSNYGVRLGGTDLRKGDEKHDITLDIGEVFIHPHYNASTWSNNIAIIELKSAVTCNNKHICTVCLPSVNIMGFTNFTMGSSHAHRQYIKDDVYQCLATGFGRKSVGITSYTPYLKEMIYAPIFNNETYCETQYFSKGGIGGSAYGAGTFCAVPQPTYQGKVVPVCQGDNGGPLACLYEGVYYLTGLSWGGNRCDHLRKSDIVAKILQPNHKTETTTTHVDFFTDVVKYIPWIYGIIYGIHA